MKKVKELELLSKQIASCDECKKEGTGMMVFGEGNPDAKIMFVGEAPGKTEAASGRPFVGRSGKLLRLLIKSIGLNTESVYITSPVKYLPLQGTPSKDQIAHAKPYFDLQVAIINPALMVLLGKTAASAALGEDIPVLSHHGTTRKAKGKTYFITIHPAAALRFQKFNSVLQEDFLTLKQLIKAL